MEYAQLTPGRRFAPLQSLLYYSQRIVTRPSLRRLVVRALSGALRLREGSGKHLYASTVAEDGALRDLSLSGYAPLGNLLDNVQCDEIQAYLRDKLLTDRDRMRDLFTLAQHPEGVRVADYHSACWATIRWTRPFCRCSAPPISTAWLSNTGLMAPTPPSAP
jgi:hypothetical protein